MKTVNINVPGVGTPLRLETTGERGIIKIIYPNPERSFWLPKEVPIFFLRRMKEENIDVSPLGYYRCFLRSLKRFAPGGRQNTTFVVKNRTYSRNSAEQTVIMSMERQGDTSMLNTHAEYYFNLDELLTGFMKIAQIDNER